VTESSQRREIYIGSRQGVPNINNAITKKIALVLETGRFLNNMLWLKRYIEKNSQLPK